MYIVYCIQSRTTVRDIWNWIGVTIKSNNVEEATCFTSVWFLNTSTIIFWGAGGKHTNSRADNEPSRNSKCPEKPPVELSRVSSVLLEASRGSSGLLGFSHGFSRLLSASRGFSRLLEASLGFSTILGASRRFSWLLDIEIEISICQPRDCTNGAHFSLPPPGRLWWNHSHFD